MEPYLFPEMNELSEEERTATAIDYPSGAEQYPELVRILDEIRKAGQNLKQSEAVWSEFVPAFDQAQKWFSRRSEEHVKLPKGLTWSRIKDWIIDRLNLEIGRRQFERRVRVYRDPGEQVEKRAAAATTRKSNAEALACADEMVAAYRAGQDISAQVEAYERARSRKVAAGDPAKIAAVVSASKKNEGPVIGGTASTTRAKSARSAGSQPSPSVSSLETLTPSTQHGKILAIPKVSTPTPACSMTGPRAGSASEQRVQVALFKKPAQAAVHEASLKTLHPFGDRSFHSLSDTGTGDGCWEFNPDQLYELLDLNSPQRIFIGDTYDLFNDRVSIEVILEHFRVFAAVPWVFFSVLTSYTQRLGQIQSALTSHRMSWPRNLEVGLTVTSTTKIADRLKVFGLYRVERKWVSLSPFESSERRPISVECPNLASVLEQSGKPRIVIGARIDRQSGRSSLSSADATFLIDSAKAAGSKIFYCNESAKLAFERGDAGAQIVNEIELDQASVKGTISALARYRELPQFRVAPVGKLTHFARSFDSIQRLKPVNRPLSRFDLMCGTALRP